VTRIIAARVPSVSAVGDQLEAVRQRRGLSQEEAGAELGVSQPRFSAYVRGEPIPHHRAPRVAHFLGIPVKQARDLILEGHEDPTPIPARQPSVSERVDRLEAKLTELVGLVEELRSTPRRGGKTTPQSPHPTARQPSPRSRQGAH
jgi:transcriptional regulator with XRE-family HTH domain